MLHSAVGILGIIDRLRSLPRGRVLLLGRVGRSGYGCSGGDSVHIDVVSLGLILLAGILVSMSRRLPPEIVRVLPLSGMLGASGADGIHDLTGGE